MGYMNIAAKAIGKNQVSARVSAKVAPKTKKKKPVPTDAKEENTEMNAVQSLNKKSAPVPGTPYAALSNLMKK